ncbi:acylphosphatase [Gryllotalpicola daejeonensis]|uniref:acylphosphatase n=1 Tax=Gryllotalpicola daejeonensis TaxID=993087 RepID=UPI0031D81AB3
MHAVVSGDVQGVGFRYAAAEHARELGVAGWVRNLPDGRVEAEVEGESGAVERMIAWLERGPRAARVAAVEVAETPVLHEDAFLIEH